MKQLNVNRTNQTFYWHNFCLKLKQQTNTNVYDKIPKL